MEDYISSTNNAILSNVTHAATFGPRYHLEFGGVAHTFSLFGGYSASDANSEQFSYHDWSIGTSYFARFKTGTELYADLRYLDRNYDAPPFVQAASDGSGDRKDQRYTVTFALTQPFLKNYFASLTYTYIENNSSGFFYDYDKNLIVVNLGANFNF